MKVPRISPQKLIKAIEKKGFSLVRQSGSHRIYRNNEGARVTIPFHAGKTLHPKIVKAAMKEAALTENDFK